MNKVLIVGCGYLGKALALLLQDKGYTVTATTRHTERLEELSSLAQKSVIIRGDDEEALTPLIIEHPIIVVVVAADRSDLYENTYLHTAKTFRHLALELGLPRQLLYTSSTSVYGDHQGLWVDETSTLLNTSQQGLVLQETEKVFLSLEEVGWTVTILRLGELYGPHRTFSAKVQQLQGRPLPGYGKQHTNVIHLDDASHALYYAIRHHLHGIYNLTDDDHMTRKDLYDTVCHKFGHRPLRFDPTLKELHGGDKRASNHKIKQEGFVFIHPRRVID
jgi:nucleoside-diphosphate-sugar epimerase